MIALSLFVFSVTIIPGTLQRNKISEYLGFPYENMTQSRIAWCIYGQIKHMARSNLHINLKYLTGGSCVDFFIAADLVDTSESFKDGCRRNTTHEEWKRIVDVLDPVDTKLISYKPEVSLPHNIKLSGPALRHMSDCVKLVHHHHHVSRTSYKYIVFSRPEIKLLTSFPLCHVLNSMKSGVGMAKLVKFRGMNPPHLCPNTQLFLVDFSSSLLYLGKNYSDPKLATTMVSDCLRIGRGQIQKNSTYGACWVPECTLEQLVFPSTDLWQEFPFDIEWRMIRNHEAGTCDSKRRRH